MVLYQRSLHVDACGSRIKIFSRCRWLFGEAKLQYYVTNLAAKDAMFPIKTLLWIWLIPVRSPAERNFVELNLLKAMEYTFQLKFLAAVVILANSISLPDIILLLFVIAVVTAYLPT